MGINIYVVSFFVLFVFFVVFYFTKFIVRITASATFLLIDR